jgi:hypothetical protein
MDILMWVIAIYLVIGLIKAINHVGSGRMGTSGPLVALITVTFLWPFL